MEELLKLLHELGSSLKKNRNIHLLECSLRDTLPDSDDVNIFRLNNPKFKSLGSLSDLFTGEGIIWKTKAEAMDFLMGEYSPSAFQKGRLVFESKYLNLVLNKNLEFSKKDGFCIYDQHPESGDGVFYFLRFPKGTLDIEIWGFVSEETEIYKLNLTLPQYVRAMCYFKCKNDWQWLFIAPEYRHKISKSRYKNLLDEMKLLKKLFPEIDIEKRDF